MENKVAVAFGVVSSIEKITAKLFLDEGEKKMIVDFDKDSLKIALP